jgi:hypothetical protein
LLLSPLGAVLPLLLLLSAILLRSSTQLVGPTLHRIHRRCDGHQRLRHAFSVRLICRGRLDERASEKLSFFLLLQNSLLKPRVLLVQMGNGLIHLVIHVGSILWVLIPV